MGGGGGGGNGGGGGVIFVVVFPEEDLLCQNIQLVCALVLPSFDVYSFLFLSRSNSEVFTSRLSL